MNEHNNIICWHKYARIEFGIWVAICSYICSTKFELFRGIKDDDCGSYLTHFISFDLLTKERRLFIILIGLVVKILLVFRFLSSPKTTSQN